MRESLSAVSSWKCGHKSQPAKPENWQRCCSPSSTFFVAVFCEICLFPRIVNWNWIFSVSICRFVRIINVLFQISNRERKILGRKKKGRHGVNCRVKPKHHLWCQKLCSLDLALHLLYFETDSAKFRESFFPGRRKVLQPSSISVRTLKILVSKFRYSRLWRHHTRPLPSRRSWRYRRVDFRGEHASCAIQRQGTYGHQTWCDLL